MTETASEAFDRGAIAGKIDARLAGHDRHFESINGSLAKIADEMHGLRLAVQRLGDQAESNATTVLTTAAALKAADDARRDQDANRWSPVTRASVVLGIVATVVTLLLTLYFAVRPA